MARFDQDGLDDAGRVRRNELQTEHKIEGARRRRLFNVLNATSLEVRFGRGRDGEPIPYEEDRRKSDRFNAVGRISNEVQPQRRDPSELYVLLDAFEPHANGAI